jgi:hypothetical protein
MYVCMKCGVVRCCVMLRGRICGDGFGRMCVCGFVYV